ncbi:MAG: ATP-binding cassette domain-containing protein [Clostridiales bacterium]|nr:ATP-binding cassette domain-containing protein [Clostridiales bacterium]
MITVSNVKLQFGARVLFENVNLKFTSGNCYGIIGANGAGKSTFLKLLSGGIEPSKGEIIIGKGERMSVLEQNQNAYDEYTVREAVICGHKELASLRVKRDELYSKGELTDEENELIIEYETRYGELGGYEAEINAESLLNNIGIDQSLFDTPMSEVEPKIKVKVLIAQSLFGEPDILLFDEPTNNLDIKTVRWLQEYIKTLENATVIIVSHNRHFLNQVCTHILDVDYNAINLFVGNYDFWYESSQLILRQQREANKKAEARIKELKEFIARFSANASKSKQATSRKRELDKIEITDIKPSSRKYPYIDFKFERDPGNDILRVEKLTKAGFFENISFSVGRDDKIGFLTDEQRTVAELFDCIFGESQPDSGRVIWGKNIKPAYMPQNYDKYFDGCELSLVKWIDQWSENHEQEYLRSWLGRLLFSGDEALKKAGVLSGGEKARCMLARMMLLSPNFLIFDEPTNHLDLESITSLNKGMINFKGPELFISADEEIMSTVSNRIIIIENGKKTYDRPVTYDEYISTL